MNVEGLYFDFTLKPPILSKLNLKLITDYLSQLIAKMIKKIKKSKDHSKIIEV